MIDERIKVSIVEPIGGHLGNEFYDFGLCKAISDEGVSVTLYTCDETTLDNKHPFNFIVKKFYRRIYGSAPKIIRGIRYVIGTLKTLSHAQKSGSSLVHFHVYHFANREFLNFLLFKWSGFKIVATIHDVESFEDFGKKINKSKYRKFEKRIDRVIVHSQFAFDSLTKYFTQFPKEKIHLVPHGDTDFIYPINCSPSEARTKLNLPQDKKLILFFGQIKKVKGVDVLLKAYTKVREKIADTQLVIAGSPWKMETGELEKIIHQHHLEKDCVLNFSFIPNELVPYYYKATDLVVLPYRKIYSSSVLTRSLDYGAAIITSDLDTFRRIIVPGENGLLFQSENDTDLAEKIIDLLQNPSLIETLRANAKKTIEDNFSWQVIGRQMNNIYNLALNG